MDYFPLALAAGKAFCNRKTERQHLSYNLQESRPTLITSPRRYGKTSLSLEVIHHAKLLYAKFDFFSATNENDIEKIMLKSIGQLLGRIEKLPTKVLKMATEAFSGLNIKLSLDKLGLSVEINKKNTPPTENIAEILERLEKLAEKQNQKIVLFFDEFQQIYQMPNTLEIESVLRQMAQSSKRLSFIFSGSHRHLLNKIFEDRNRPFYKLCDRITLERIHEQDYVDYIQTAALATWKHPLSPEILQAVFACTQRHPYYMNLLCSRLWKLSELTEKEVYHTWQTYALEEQAQVANELDLLSTSQRKLLISLARYEGNASLRSREFEMASRIPGTTITQAVKFLEQRDYIYKDEKNTYQILDPLMKHLLSET